MTRQRWFRLIAAASLLGLGGIMLLAVIILRYGRVNRARPADVIIVLGSGDVGTTRRTWHAVELYQQGYAPVLLCTGGVSARDAAPTEAALCAQIATERGVPVTAILTETASKTTEQNAINSAAILRARGWSSAVLVTDDYHLLRARWMFDQQGVHVFPSPAQTDESTLGYAYVLLREIGALGYHTGKTLLGLP